MWRLTAKPFVLAVSLPGSSCISTAFNEVNSPCVMKCYTENLDRLDLLHFPSKKKNKILFSWGRDQVAGYLLPVVNLYHLVLFSVALCICSCSFFFFLTFFSPCHISFSPYHVPGDLQDYDRSKYKVVALSREIWLHINSVVNVVILRILLLHLEYER